MSRMSFRLGFKSTEMQSLDLPVEIRKPNLTLVESVLSSQTVEVEPGKYLVSATLPAGQELFSEVDVGDSTATVVLAPDPADESKNENHEQQRFMSKAAPVPLAFGLLESLGATDIQVSVGLLQGKDPKQSARTQIAVAIEPLEAGFQFRINGGAFAGPAFLEILRPGWPARHIAVPAGPGQNSLVVGKVVPGKTEDQLTVDVHLGNAEADLLLCGLGRGYLREASRVLNSMQMTAEKLLDRKVDDPISAAVGAYSLLQFGELDRLHDWTQNLMNWFPWLPDGLSVRGEHLARIGQHQEALAVLAELPSRGAPQFTVGLGYAVNRLRVYMGMTKEFDQEVLKRAGQALTYLEDISQYVDFLKPVLTTEGARSDAQYPDGLDISQLISDSLSRAYPMQEQ